MNTDSQIYTFLSTGTEAFRIITGGIILPGPYKFSAPVLKGVKRRIDALFEPDGHAGPVYVVEFQTTAKPHVWYNLLAKIALYGEEYPHCKVQGIIIFPTRAADARNSQWIRSAAPGLLSSVYLEDFLPDLVVDEADNPLVAVLTPLIEDNLDTLKKLAPSLWRSVQAAPEPLRTTLGKILEFWFFERFKNFTDQEMLDMFGALVPLEETRAYQCIVEKVTARGMAKWMAEGMAEGMTKGTIEGELKGAATVLTRQIIRRFGKLPKWAQKRIDKADKAQLEAWAEAIFDAENIKQLLS